MIKLGFPFVSTFKVKNNFGKKKNFFYICRWNAIFMETFPLDSAKIYYSADMLTLDCETGPVTLKLSEWLHEDPVRIHRMIIKEKLLQVDQMEVFAPLVSKLRRADYEYYKRITGLKMIIDFPGFSSEVEARIPYDTDPVAFYKWWRKGKNENRVYLSPAYQFKLFQKVAKMEPKIMLKKDIDFVKNF